MTVSGPRPTPGPRSRPGLPEHVRACVLLKHGEVFLRGRNRARFEELLYGNLRDALRTLPGPVWLEKGRNVTVVGGEVPLERLVDRVRRVIGFSVVQPAVRVPGTVEDLGAHAVDALRRAGEERAGSGGEPSFAVRVKRRDKSFPLTSSELAAALGERVRRATGARVDLSAPDVELVVEVDRGAGFVSGKRIPGQGGLPVGSSGRAPALLSGGYDSPVAAYRAMRRGLACDFVHFTGAPYADASSVYKAYALARELNRFQLRRALWVVPLGRAQKQLAGAGRLHVVARRRLMARTASALAGRLGAEALVAGDSLGQVASQTVANMAAVDEAPRCRCCVPCWAGRSRRSSTRRGPWAPPPSRYCPTRTAARCWPLARSAPVPGSPICDGWNSVRGRPAGLAEELLAGAWTLAPGADEVPAADTAGAERAGRV